jgi:hypothetical protein
LAAPSERDDLEGLGYVFAYLQQNNLPWANSDGECQHNVTELKMSTPTAVLFQGMDPAYVRYFNAVKALAWNESPNYEGMIEDFNQAWKKRGYVGSPFEVNWWKEFALWTKHEGNVD